MVTATRSTPEGTEERTFLAASRERFLREVGGHDHPHHVAPPGRGEVLNFGHTLGHALEAATGYRYSLHGEAVAWGMIGACWLSWRKGLLDGGDFKRIEALLLKLPKPPLPRVSAEELLVHIRRDKKIVGGTLHYALLKGIGEAVVDSGVTADELLFAWQYICGLGGSR